MGVRLAGPESLVGPRGMSRALTEEHLSELALLTRTAGGRVVGEVVQERERPDAAYFIGRGKAKQIAERVEADAIDTVIFDDELSPAQVRNLEAAIPAKILDRAGLILDIFARRARTREARTQVELAQLQYLMPRLTRRWTHLSRQAGGTIGLRGVGETQLEIDRRLIRRRIARLREELERVDSGRRQRRHRREGLYKVALIGYTNAGKSTLFNALSGGSDARVEDRLFATLDPLVRRCHHGGSAFLVIDTVGFIRKLPHDLVASFRSTLKEAEVADLLVHVVDASHPRYEEQLDVTTDVLDGLDVLDRPVLTVFNKIDEAGSGALARAEALHPEAVFVSALRRTGLDVLGRRIVEQKRFHRAARTGSAGAAARRAAAKKAVG